MSMDFSSLSTAGIVLIGVLIVVLQLLSTAEEKFPGSIMSRCKGLEGITLGAILLFVVIVVAIVVAAVIPPIL
jgi:hypothetical protein